MPSKQEIITALYNGQNFNDCLQKMEPAHLREDLKQEVALIVCEWPEEKIQQLHEKKQLEFYVVRVILNQIASNTSPFHKKYRRIVVEWADQFFGEYDTDTWIDDNINHIYNSSKGRNFLKMQDREEMTDHEERQLREHIEDIALAEIDKLYWYDKEMILLYKQVGSFRAMEEKTKIPFVSCFKNVKKSLETLKRRANEIAGGPLFTKEEIKTL